MGCLNGQAYWGLPIFVSRGGPLPSRTMTLSDVAHQLEQLVFPVCEAHGVELVQVRVLKARGTVVRVMIDRARPNGEPGSDVTVEDCKLVSRDLSTAFDVHEELLPGAYHLEVSSPGLDRPLVKPADFERFAGEEIKIRTRVPVGGRRGFTGELQGISDGVVRLLQDGASVEIPHADIDRANLVYRF